MLFFKSKKYDEILPPPPPEAELEEIEKPELFDEVIKPEKAKETKEEAEFEDLLKEVKALKPKKVSKKLKTISKEKKLIAKKPKVIKKQVKKIKEKKIPIKKIIPVKRLKEKKTKKQKAFELPELEERELKEPKFELPKEEQTEKEIKLPETLEDFDIEDLGKELELEPKTKPKELIEAEEEIKNAIENIKEQEKPSILKRLFAKKEKIEETESLMPEVDGMSEIKNDLNKAREALMKFDLDTAKKNYIEIMRIYNNLRPEEQAKIYHEIRDLYFERKSAEELKV